MAEIIKAGKLPEENWFQTSCNKCGTKFKFQKKELKEKGDQRDGYYKSLVCPLPFCFNEVLEPSQGFDEYTEERPKKPAQIDGPWNVTR